jgi:hypothetical protein
MDEGAHRITADEPEQPEDQQNHGDGVEHGHSPSTSAPEAPEAGCGSRHPLRRDAIHKPSLSPNESHQSAGCRFVPPDIRRAPPGDGAGTQPGPLLRCVPPSGESTAGRAMTDAPPGSGRLPIQSAGHRFTLQSILCLDGSNSLDRGLEAPFRSLRVGRPE